jgi:AcrR family transcriptional regulator
MVQQPRRSDGEKTRIQLLDAGRRAFSRKGVVATNLREDILQPAGVAPGSFYHQFTDKTDLLLAILDEHAGSFRERLSKVMASGPGSSFEEIARRAYEFAFAVADEEGELLRIQHYERRSTNERIAGYLAENLELWIQTLASACERLARGIDEEIDGRLAAELIVKLGLVVVDDYLDLPEAERATSRARLLEGLVDFTVGGLPGLVRERTGAGGSP